MKALKDSAIYLIGELAAKSIPFLLLPYLSRKLGVEGYGQLSYFQTYLALFIIIVGLSQEGAVARYFYFYGKRSLNLVVNMGYLYTLIVGSVIFIACLVFNSEIMAYLALAAIFQSFLAVQLSIRQCQKQVIPYTIIQLFSAILGAVLTVVILELYQTDLVEKRFLALLLSNLTAFLVAYFIYRNKATLKAFSFSKYKSAMFYVLGFGLPLILHHASLFLRGQLDRVFIYHKFSEAELGIYAMGAQIASILTILILAVNKATVPYVYEGLKKKTITLSKIYKWTVLSFLIVPIPALIALILPEDVILWVLGQQFIGTKYYIVLFLLSVSLMIPYLLLVNYLFYHGKNKMISYCSALSTLIYVVALIALTFTKIEYVPYASIIGAVAILPILYFMTKKVSQSV